MSVRACAGDEATWVRSTDAAVVGRFSRRSHRRTTPTAKPQEDDADEDSDQEQLRGAHEKP